MLKVMIIEDEPLIALNLTKILEKKGFEVTGHAGNFEDAHTLFATNIPDIVLSDIKLENDESGIDVIQNLKRMSDFCVIYLTSYGDDAMIEKALSTNPAAYITKPFKDIDLNAALKLVSAKIKNKNINPDFYYNKETQALFYKNEQIVLSKQESDLFHMGYLSKSDEEINLYYEEEKMATEALKHDNALEKSSILARRDFLKYSTGALSVMCSTAYGSSKKEKIIEYPIDAKVVTTLQRTVVPRQQFSSIIPPKDLQHVSTYEDKGYGTWDFGDGIKAEERQDIMPNGYSLPTDGKKQKLLKFFAITDIHITDKESPSQLIYLQPANVVGGQHGMDIEDKMTSMYSPVMLYTTHVLDAAIQTVNALHQQDTIDFGISLGDTCNSTQYNETRWYIDVMDGKVITPSSGENRGAKNIDYQRPFQAAGLHKEIPWYQTLGNHDHFWLGSIPLDVGDLKLRESYVSPKVIAMPNSFVRASDVFDMSNPLYYMGVIDGATKYGTIIKAGPIQAFPQAPEVTPDVKRRSLTKEQWAEEFFHTTRDPQGHGLNLVPSGQNPEFACYSFMPKSKLPLKVIVLDDTQSEHDGDKSIHGRGFLSQARWDWLKKELKAGSNANQLMIIACHIPIAVSPHKSDKVPDTYMDWYENTRFADMENAVTLPDLIKELHSHPNLLMWIAGHRHVNTVKAFIHEEPEKGFWQVETSSLRDFPQQLRLFELSLTSDYTLSIDVTNVDPAVKVGTPAWVARKYAVATQQIVKNDVSPNFVGADPKYPGVMDPTIKPVDKNTGVYNAKLLKQLTPTMKAKMQALFPEI